MTAASLSVVLENALGACWSPADDLDGRVEDVVDDLEYGFGTLAALPLQDWPEMLREHYTTAAASFGRVRGRRPTGAQIAEARTLIAPLAALPGLERWAVVLRRIVAAETGVRVFSWSAIAAAMGVSEAEAKRAALDGLTRIARAASEGSR